MDNTDLAAMTMQATGVMQAMGLLNDHMEGCASRIDASDARSLFKSPVRGSGVIL